MKNVNLVLLMVTSLLCGLCACRKEGKRCEYDGIKGICKNIRSCPYALKNIKNKIKPPLCSFSEKEPVVCCVDPAVWYSPRMADVTRNLDIKPSSTAAAVGGTTVPSDHCEPVPNNMTAPKTGHKAFDKCVEYQEKLVLPCQKSMTPSGGKTRANYCNWKPESFVIDGENAHFGEFPHMALLGYGRGTVEWLSGGFLISERFVLTAAHCTFKATRGRVTKIKIGLLHRSDEVHARRYDVLHTHTHPEYRSPSKYHDIALLESHRRMALNRFAVPACLHDGRLVNDDKVLVTGWGTTKFMVRAESNILQKVTLTKFSDKECSDKMRGVRLLTHGYDPTTQVCYGDKVTSKDSCNGDSGGPAQIKHPQIYCMYMVTGVVSWGKRCGVANEPGVYTRVAPYVPWIEGIVWP